MRSGASDLVRIRLDLPRRHEGTKAMTFLRVFVPSWLILILVATACGQRGGAGKTTIAVIPKGTSHVFWQSIHAGAEKAAQELGVTVVWRGPLREDDRSSQVNEVQGFITR